MAVESEHDCEIVILKASNMQEKLEKIMALQKWKLFFCISLDNYRYHINGDHLIRPITLSRALKNSVT
jgi:hypothetical protein